MNNFPSSTSTCAISVYHYGEVYSIQH